LGKEERRRAKVGQERDQRWVGSVGRGRGIQSGREYSFKSMRARTEIERGMELRWRKFGR
jgi:hypothetical protein